MKNAFEIRRLGEVFEVETGSTPSTAIPEYWEGGTIKWITPLDLGKLKSPFISQTSRSITQKGLQNSSATLVPRGSIIISTRAPIGYIAVLTEPMAFNQGCKALLPKNGNEIEPLYVYYQLQTKVREMNRLGSGSTFKEISKEKLESIRIQLPPLLIQKQIAAILEKADAAREKRQQANQLTEQFLQSAFLEMFGDGTHQRAKLRDVCRIITDGTHVTPKYSNQGVPFVSVKDVRSKRIDFSDVKYISEEEHRFITRRCRPEKGDILYTKVGATFGNAVVVDVDIEFSIFVSLALLKPKFDIIDPTFLKYMMNTDFVKSQARQRVRGIAVPDLHLVEIKDFDIYLPAMDEQRKFLALVEKVELLRTKQGESGKELEKLFQSLMQKAFRGELVS